MNQKELASFRQAVQRRRQIQARDTEQQRRRAWQLARRAARLLKKKYGAKRVIVFGSLAHGAWFHARSDVDLAVEGLAPGTIWRAWSAVERVIAGFEVDLVELETASLRLGQRIREQGKEL